MICRRSLSTCFAPPCPPRYIPATTVLWDLPRWPDAETDSRKRPSCQKGSVRGLVRHASWPPGRPGPGTGRFRREEALDGPRRLLPSFRPFARRTSAAQRWSPRAGPFPAPLTGMVAGNGPCPATQYGFKKPQRKQFVFRTRSSAMAHTVGTPSKPLTAVGTIPQGHNRFWLGIIL
jgi:hypothetical protein